MVRFTREHATQIWQWAARGVGVLFGLTVLGAVVLLASQAGQQRVINAELAAEIDASQANAEKLYQQLVELGQEPEGEKPTEVVGERGPRGETGQRGSAGRDGEDGQDGQDGRDGVDGKTGATGQAGTDGANGVDGVNGTDGAPGATGPSGPAGPAGPQGPPGQIDSWTMQILGVEYLCQIDGTPPPYRYTCTPTLLEPVG